ncbi:hypothetical protein [Nocardia wallacei]|uniref:hypothetical protein n=1 Tax=Nocardia wallacei TaxID=480035 RepID=UPI002456F593|nr:hypothetical protein [Nocardia wallacei]
MRLVPGRSARNPWIWARHNVVYPLMARMQRPPKGAHLGWRPYREFGFWVVRPRQGWRRFRWITPGLYYTRSIPASDEYAAFDWAMERLGIGESARPA